MKDVITVESSVSAPVEKVWAALTEKEKMKQWYFDLNAFKPETGFEFSFHGQGRQGEKYIHLCKITEVIPLKKLQYSWRYENHPGNSLVTFELSKEGQTTRVKLTHEGIETFPKHPDFASESFKEGWTQLITKLLPEFLSK